MNFLNVDPKIFDSSEFDSPDSPGSGILMNLAFIQKLYKVRLACGFPFLIDSGYRSVNHNIKVGGEPDSEHLEGLAADIKILNSDHRFKIINEALKVGFTRIGIGDSFIHLGNSINHLQYIIWTYPTGTYRRV